MTTAARKTRNVIADAPGSFGFDVMVLRTIGTVTPDGDHPTMLHAAFALIADQSMNDRESGEYSFPGPDGGTVSVAVDFPSTDDREPFIVSNDR